jgi:hypothetical protein
MSGTPSSAPSYFAHHTYLLVGTTLSFVGSTEGVKAEHRLMYRCTNCGRVDSLSSVNPGFPVQYISGLLGAFDLGCPRSEVSLGGEIVPSTQPYIDF